MRPMPPGRSGWLTVSLPVLAANLFCSFSTHTHPPVQSDLRTAHKWRHTPPATRTHTAPPAPTFSLPVQATLPSPPSGTGHSRGAPTPGRLPHERKHTSRRPARLGDQPDRPARHRQPSPGVAPWQPRTAQASRDRRSHQPAVLALGALTRVRLSAASAHGCAGPHGPRTDVHARAPQGPRCATHTQSPSVSLSLVGPHRSRRPSRERLTLLAVPQPTF